MASLIKMKRRINSIASTKKITKAMELIATTKLKKYKDLMFANRLYETEISQMMRFLNAAPKTENLEKFYQEGPSDKDLYVVINSNLGLCGSYNYDLYKFVLNNVQKDDAILLPLGSKGEKYYGDEGYNVELDYNDLNQAIDYARINKFARFLTDNFLSGKYRNVYVIYTKFVNSLTFVPTLVKVLPIVNEDAAIAPFSYAPLLDSLIESIFLEALPLYVNSFFLSKIVESLVSEQALRRNSMENANDNAEELIENLTREYNKERQNSITGEISDVISASLR